MKALGAEICQQPDCHSSLADMPSEARRPVLSCGLLRPGSSIGPARWPTPGNLPEADPAVRQAADC
jgi:hypothetical protein